MKLIGLILCRNSEWVIEATIHSAMQWCDELVILDHASTDATPSIAKWCSQTAFPRRIHYIRDDDPVFSEMRMRQKTLDVARANGGDFLAIIDDDELLTSNLIPTIRGAVESLTPGQCLQLPWRHCWRSLENFRVDPTSQFSKGMKSMAFCDAPFLHWTAKEDGYPFHHTHPYGATFVQSRVDGGWFHLQHANWDRVFLKQLWYQMTEMLQWNRIRADYSGTIREDGLQLATVPPHWWGAEKSLVRIDDDPWQRLACAELLKQHGMDRFAMCDLLPLAFDAKLIK
jgi:hypothetical protein